MDFMSFEECKRAGYEPHAVYGGKVYSFWCLGFVIPHGSKDYENVLDDVRATLTEQAQKDSRAAAPDLAAEVIRLRTALNLVIENVEATGSSHADRLAAINVVVRAALTEQVS